MSVVDLSIRLPARAPFDGMGLMRFFADHAIVGVETGDDTHFARRVRLPNGLAAIRLELDGPAGVILSAQVDSPLDVETLTEGVRRMLDLDADAPRIDSALSGDPALANLVVAAQGLRLPGTLDPAETLFRTLLGQQVSVASTRTVLGRISGELCGETGLFPTATQFAERGHEVLRGPAARVSAIIGVAEALASGSLTIDPRMPAAELTAHLVALPGVGPWTAGYLSMRVLGDPDVLLTSDLVMVKSAAALGIADSAKSLAAAGARWAPWRTYAGLHLWRAATDARRAAPPLPGHRGRAEPPPLDT